MPAASGSTSGTPPANANANKRRGKKRIRSFTAEERATHSTIEKQRREALNANSIDLARLIPALAPVHRLSKALIVSESIKHFRAQREMCLAAASEIQAILAENVELTAEINSWREQYGVGLGPRQVKPVGDAVQELLKLDQQVLGTFPAGFGDNGPGGEQEDGQGVDNGGRLDLEEQRGLPPSDLHSQVEGGTISNTELNFQGDTFVSLSEPHNLAADSNDLSEILRIPNGFLDTHQMAAQPSSLQNQDPFSSLDVGYDATLGSHPNNPSSFEDLNLHHNILADFPPEMGFYLPEAHEMNTFGYAP